MDRAGENRIVGPHCDSAEMPTTCAGKNSASAPTTSFAIPIFTPQCCPTSHFYTAYARARACVLMPTLLLLVSPTFLFVVFALPVLRLQVSRHVMIQSKLHRAAFLGACDVLNPFVRLDVPLQMLGTGFRVFPRMSCGWRAFNMSKAKMGERNKGKKDGCFLRKRRERELSFFFRFARLTERIVWCIQACHTHTVAETRAWPYRPPENAESTRTRKHCRRLPTSTKISAHGCKREKKRKKRKGKKRLQVITLRVPIVPRQCGCVHAPQAWPAGRTPDRSRGTDSAT